jgi:hypothetical protein
MSETTEPTKVRQRSNGCEDNDPTGTPCCDGCWCEYEAQLEADGLVQEHTS